MVFHQLPADKQIGYSYGLSMVDDTGIEPVTYISIYPYGRNSYLVRILHEWQGNS